MDAKIMEQIIRRIMSDPSLAALLSDAPQQMDACGRVLVLVNHGQDVEKRLSCLAQSWSGKCSLEAVLSPGAVAAGVKLPLGITAVDENAAWQNFQQWQRVVMPAISQNTLAKLAMGIRDGGLVELAAKAIEGGVKLDVVPGFVIPSTAPKPWIAMYDGYFQQLRSYQVCVHQTMDSVIACPGCDQRGSCIFPSLLPPGIKPEQITVPLVQQPQAQVNILAGGGAREQQVAECLAQVLTERDVRGLPKNSVVKLGQRTIITPLAKECMSERQIDYFREGERAQ